MKSLLSPFYLGRWVFVLVLLIVVLNKRDLYGADRTLEWDSNPESAISGYRLFCRQEGQPYDYNTPIWEGDKSQNGCTIHGLDDDTIYYFVIRAFDSIGNESSDSNEVPYMLVGFSIDGPEWVDENNTAVFRGTALFRDQMAQPATNSAVWSMDSPYANASIGWNEGLGEWLLNFSTLEVLTDQKVTLIAKYSFGDETAVDMKDIWIANNLQKEDTDVDGMPDWWESAHSLNRLVDDSKADSDGDGLSNLEEYQHGTDPKDPNSTIKKGCNGEPYLQATGFASIVAFEVENFDANVSQGDHDWEHVYNVGDPASDGMKAMPEVGDTVNKNYVSQTPRLDFKICFITTGQYYVWVRGIGGSSQADSCHVGLEGAAVETCESITSFGKDWTWSNETKNRSVATIDISSTGTHTINLWMKEDGFVVDKIVLTTDEFYVPEGEGPPESPRL
jgi:hypothetical protein